MSARGEAADRVARRLRIEGQVQGVWFRNWTQETAARLGVDGWVRNLGDGSVEAVVAGSPEAVGLMILACHRGPPAARVARICLELAEDPGPGGFRRARTE